MSSEYYFTKWQRVLSKLEKILEIDLNYQESRAHEKTLCMIVQRLTGMLAGYSTVFNETIDCFHHNVQCQKAEYMKEILRALTRRILELRRQLEKLEHSNNQFISRGLTDVKLTPYDVELSDIPEKAIRPPEVQKALEDISKRIHEERQRMEEENEAAVPDPLSEDGSDDLKWWGSNEPEDENKIIEEDHTKEPLDQEQLTRRTMLNLILAQEKARQVLHRTQQDKQKREIWAKELEGTARPQASIEMKTKAAQMIQKMMRAYFKIKRQKIIDCKRDEILGIRMCKKPKCDERDKSEELSEMRIERKNKYENEWRAVLENMKIEFSKRRGEDIQEDYRDEIRGWFYKWYTEVWFLYDIPKAYHGGSTLILNGSVPEPVEWLEENARYMEQLKASKKKSPLQLKQEKMAAKKEEQMLKRQQLMKKKQEEALLKKMMKNPTMHPGFTYPKSKQINNVMKAVENYLKHWQELDEIGERNVKEKSIREIDGNNVWSEIKECLRPNVDDDMRIEQKTLKNALKNEYEVMEEEWPTVMPQKYPKVTTKKETKQIVTDKIADAMVNLALNGYVKDYPKTKFQDFKGEPNFAGDDLRCNFIHAFPYGGETRHVWWERCLELVQGFRKILLVGPAGSGKKLLIHAMATVNDAAMFELEPTRFDESTTEDDLKELINSIALCAKASQPSVIYLRNIQRLYFTKAQNGEYLDVNLLRKYLIRKLMKKFNKTDKITILAGVLNPWLTKSNNIVKLFPSVILMPNTTYTTTGLILREWVWNNRAVPPDLDTSCLAKVLQGYSYGFLKNALDNFLSPERIVKIASQGLKPEEIYEYILRDEEETKVEYDKYLAWYADKTHWGAAEKKHLAAQLEFQALARKYAEKMAKKKNQSAASSLAASAASSVATMR